MLRKMSGRTAAGWALASLGLLLAARFAWAEASSASVTIRTLAFRPGVLSVAAGTTVSFSNGDDVAHSIVASDGSFRTPEIRPGSAATVTFKTPGTFSYFCGVHPFMEGRVIVAPAASKGSLADKTGLSTNDR